MDNNMRLVITLKSGKSIVCTLKNDEIFKIEMMYRTFLMNDKNTDDNACKCINIVKEQNGKVYEIVTIDITEISSIQVEDFYKK